MTSTPTNTANIDTVREGELLWTPRPQFVQDSGVMRFLDWLRAQGRQNLSDYDALWRWSVDDLEGFWGAIWDYFAVISDAPYQRVIDSHGMPGTRWFDGSFVNYAEHLLRHETRAPQQPALYHASELRANASTSWEELGAAVRVVATRLRELGVVPGDRVVAYVPNVPEAVIAMIATVAIGAIWSSAAPEFGVKIVVERFSQIAPKVLLAADGYRFGGKDFPRSDEVREIAANLPTLERTIWLPYLQGDTAVPDGLPGAMTWANLLDHAPVPREGFRFERVPCDHALWVVFSSGTTGLPKAIVHSHVGALVEHLKLTAFHLNMTPDATMFFYTTTGWMMWNLLVGALLQGGSIVLYDGSPVHPDAGLLWKLAEDFRVTNLGASPSFVQMMQKAGLVPRERYNLERLEAIVVSGAPSTPETFAWFYRDVKRDLWVTSQSGGTELCSGFVGASPTLPVYAGEIQTRMLGMDVHAWNDAGEEVLDEVGELVVTQPFPSMPIFFWNDADGKRYHESYFDVFPGVWRHGDFIRINPRGGCYIYGRSDSTLNRHGVRIGTAEIYRCVDRLPQIADSLVVCCELPGGRFFMPLFVKLKPGFALDAALRERINAQLRAEGSPRHVPDNLYAVEKIPCTLTGKKMEVPVRKILMGWPVDKAASRDAMADPAALDYFIAFAQNSTDYQWRAAPSNGVA